MHAAHVDHDDLDCSQNDTPIDMLKLRHHPFANMLALLLVLGHITGQRVQDGNSSPLGAFIQRDQQFVQDIGGNDEDGGIRGGRGRLRCSSDMDVCQSCDSVSDNLRTTR